MKPRTEVDQTNRINCFQHPHSYLGFDINSLSEWHYETGKKLFIIQCIVGANCPSTLEGYQGDPTSPSYRKSVLRVHWNLIVEAENSNILTT